MPIYFSLQWILYYEILVLILSTFLKDCYSWLGVRREVLLQTVSLYKITLYLKHILLVIIYNCTSVWQKTNIKEVYQSWTVHSFCLDILMYFEAVRFIWCFSCNKTFTSGKHCVCVWFLSHHLGQTLHWRRWTILTAGKRLTPSTEMFHSNQIDPLCLKTSLGNCP